MFDDPFCRLNECIPFIILNDFYKQLSTRSLHLKSLSKKNKNVID